jgi:hypothetical protein
MTNKKVRVDMDRHGRYAMVQHRGINPGHSGSKLTYRQWGLTEAL